MIEAVGIIVPAHDEEALIGSCLDALERARVRVASHVATYLVLVLDHCRDRTRMIAEKHAYGEQRVIEVDFANVGKARAAGAEEALRHFEHHDPRRVWLATTDADSRVSPDWLLKQLAAADSGADALAGTIEVDSCGRFAPSYVEAFKRFYAAGGDAHPHVHGANLGVRADAYQQAGGFAALATGEDHALWNTLRRCGRHVVSQRDVRVITSGRLQARAPLGFAHFLATFALSLRDES